MSPSEKALLLLDLEIEKELAFNTPEPNIKRIDDIRDKLLSLEVADKWFFRDFVKALKNSLFENSVSYHGFNLSLFEPPQIEMVEKMTEEDINPREVSISSVRAEYKPNLVEEFMNVYNYIQHEISTLKGYFFFQLMSHPDNEYVPLILHDTRCYYQPLQKKLKGNIEKTLCMSIEEFKEELEVKQNYSNVNFICILLLATKVNDKNILQQIQTNLLSCFGFFGEFQYLSLRKILDPQYSDIVRTSDQDVFFDEIEYVTSTLLINAELSNDEEKLIKKLFHSVSNVLEYKVLKGGKSGSKVLEVRPKLHYSGEIAKRFVVKFGPINEKKKIFKESAAFARNIENYKTANYHAKHYEKNHTTEGMKYSYASQDAVKTSYSYSTILSTPENVYYSERKNIVNDLFNFEPFDFWKQSLDFVEINVGALYESYLKPSKLFEYVKLIKGINETELEQEPLFKNFQTIFDYTLKTKQKVCHGDLHSENFFKDEDGIYLIDFGFTALNHALVDHTALECSIKFKHVPNYITVENLMHIEDQLLLDESFNASFRIQTDRKDLIDYFEIINAIRHNSISYWHNPQSSLEYLISLFIMTCRQILYNDLNQLYALKSAEKISEKITQLIQ